ncbi:DNA pilot protein [Termite gut associated microvirus 2]|nr:DNA pilot protein [Termite gut associated microvirus 2]
MWPAIIAAGATLASGALNYFGNQSANAQNAELQEDMAKNGVRWRVADAKAAGIHPAYALGANLPSASPSYQAGDFGFLSDAGQHIGRAVQAKATAQERELSLQSAALQVENQQLQNDYLRSQIAVMNQPAQPPSLPSPLDRSVVSGQNAYQVNPAQVTASGGQPWQEAGAYNDVSFIRTPEGFAMVPSSDAKQRIEDMFIPEIQWSIRNQLLPSRNASPPIEWLHELYPGAKRWVYNFFASEWRPDYSDSRYDGD